MAAMTEPRSNRIDGELLKILVCPLARTPVVQVGDWLYSTDSVTRRKYPVRDGLPIMLIDESVVVNDDEFRKAMSSSGVAAASDSAGN